MARPMTPLEKSYAWDILTELTKYAMQPEVQSIPNPNAFYEKVIAEKYPLSKGGFDYWWMRLIWAGWIKVDPLTHAVSIKDIVLRKRD